MAEGCRVVRSSQLREVWMQGSAGGVSRELRSGPRDGAKGDCRVVGAVPSRGQVQWEEEQG